MRRRTGAIRVGRGINFLLLLGLTGCVSPWWNSFLDPSQVGNFRDRTVNEIQGTIGFCDTPPGVPGAGDPKPEDLVQTVSEYQIGVGDILSIRMLDFLMRDVETEFTPTVDELGYIMIPQLGWIHVEGMTIRELRGELIQRAKDAGIYRRESEPAVVISFLNQQARVYHISGTIATPGRYRIVPPDFRLREAINQAGGLDPSVKTIYIFRNEPKPRKVIERGVHPGVTTVPSPDAPVPPVAPLNGWQPPTEGGPPVAPMTLSEQAAGPNAPNLPAAAPVTRPETAATEQAERELIEVISEQPPASPGVPQPATPAPPPAAPGSATSPSLPPFIFVNDRFIESPAATQQAAPPAPAPEASPEAEPAPAPAAPTSPLTPPSAEDKPISWQELTADGQQRIIRVPADKLQNGDPQYNIVIRHDDWIRLDSGYMGFFYIMGHVVRPGVYSLTGQQITLRQAVAAAGGLDALAWPTRCEIVRRVEGDREETTQWNLARIMDGQDPDIYLKPDDVVNVGTHAAAPFLATVRNAFRLTYGFGFVYDRNFADLDSFGPQQNPTDRRRFALQQRFPGLFP